MNEKRTKEMDLNSVLLEFRIEAAGAPNPAVLDAYCRKYPQYARELAGYAVQWLIGDALAATVPANETAYSAGSSPLVSRAISRFHDRLRSSAEEGGARPGEVNLNKQKVEHLISLINTASEQGAPWSKYVVSPTSRNGK